MEMELLKAVGQLKEAGYVVCLFSPDELKGADTKAVEKALHREGKELINDLKAGS